MSDRFTITGHLIRYKGRDVAMLLPSILPSIEAELRELLIGETPQLVEARKQMGKMEKLTKELREAFQEWDSLGLIPEDADD